MPVTIFIEVTDITPAIMDSYGNKVTKPEVRVEERFTIQADTRKLAVAKAQKILEIV